MCGLRKLLKLCCGTGDVWVVQVEQPEITARKSSKRGRSTRPPREQKSSKREPTSSGSRQRRKRRHGGERDERISYNLEKEMSGSEEGVSVGVPRNIKYSEKNDQYAYTPMGGNSAGTSSRTLMDSIPVVAAPKSKLNVPATIESPVIVQAEPEPEVIAPVSVPVPVPDPTPAPAPVPLQKALTRPMTTTTATIQETVHVIQEPVAAPAPVPESNNPTPPLPPLPAKTVDTPYTRPLPGTLLPSLWNVSGNQHRDEAETPKPLPPPKNCVPISEPSSSDPSLPSTQAVVAEPSTETDSTSNDPTIIQAPSSDSSDSTNTTSTSGLSSSVDSTNRRLPPPSMNSQVEYIKERPGFRPSRPSRQHTRPPISLNTTTRPDRSQSRTRNDRRRSHSRTRSDRLHSRERDYDSSREHRRSYEHTRERERDPYSNRRSHESQQRIPYPPHPQRNMMYGGVPPAAPIAPPSASMGSITPLPTPPNIPIQPVPQQHNPPQYDYFTPRYAAIPGMPPPPNLFGGVPGTTTMGMGLPGMPPSVPQQPPPPPLMRHTNTPAPWRSRSPSPAETYVDHRDSREEQSQVARIPQRENTVTPRPPRTATEPSGPMEEKKQGQAPALNITITTTTVRKKRAAGAT